MITDTELNSPVGECLYTKKALCSRKQCIEPPVNAVNLRKEKKDYHIMLRPKVARLLESKAMGGKH